MEKLLVKVSGVDFVYGEGEIGGVRIRFNVTDPTGEVSMSGRVEATIEEYFKSPNFSLLADLVVEKLVARLQMEEIEAA